MKRTGRNLVYLIGFLLVCLACDQELIKCARF